MTEWGLHAGHVVLRIARKHSSASKRESGVMPNRDVKLFPHLNDLVAFEAAARHLSFTKAADELHVTQGAVSKQIIRLERRLGGKLFLRKARVIELTENGALLLPLLRETIGLLRRVIDCFELTTGAARAREPGGALANPRAPAHSSF